MYICKRMGGGVNQWIFKYSFRYNHCLMQGLMECGLSLKNPWNSQSRSSHSLGDPYSLCSYLIRGNLINIKNKASVLGKKKITKGQRSVEGKGKKEALPILDLLIRVRTAMGISYTLSLLNDYIGLGKRHTLRVTHPIFFFLYWGFAWCIALSSPHIIYWLMEGGGLQQVFTPTQIQKLWPRP